MASMEIQDPREKHGAASPNQNTETSPQWRGQSLEALHESEARVAAAYAVMHEFSASIQGHIEALKEQIRVSEMARNAEVARPRLLPVLRRTERT